MARNPDPKPGRWILPLVVIGMVAFTYVFVSNLDTGVEATVQSTTTSSIDPLGADTVVTTSTVAADATTQAYLDQLTLLNTDLEALDARLKEINSDWDARAIDFSTARDALRDEVIPDVEAWATRVGEAVAPPTYTTEQETLAATAQSILAATQAVLAGLESSDTGEARAAALVDFNAALTSFQTGVNALTTSAG